MKTTLLLLQKFFQSRLGLLIFAGMLLLVIANLQEKIHAPSLGVDIPQLTDEALPLWQYDDFSLSQTNLQTHHQLRLSSPQASYNNRQEEVYLTTPRGVFNKAEQGITEFNAQQGWFQQKSKLLGLDEEVKVINHQDQWQLSAAALRIDTQHKQLSAPKNFRLELSKAYVAGSGLHYAEDTQKITIEHHDITRIEP